MKIEKQLLCLLDDLKDPGSRGFSVGDSEMVDIFVIRRQGQVFAYQNQCPHTGAPLEWKSDQFLDFENLFIQCAIHGALFEIENGKCIRGPCAGDSLRPVELRVEENKIYLQKNEESQTDSTPD